MENQRSSGTVERHFCRALVGIRRAMPLIASAKNPFYVYNPRPPRGAAAGLDNQSPVRLGAALSFQRHLFINFYEWSVL